MDRDELAWSIKDLLYGIKSTSKMIFVLVYFRALKRKPELRICKSDNAFRFSRFLVPSRQRNHRKSFAKENFRAPARTSVKCCCGNKTGNPKRAVSLHLARSGSQSQRGIWFILPARGACPIINIYIIDQVRGQDGWILAKFSFCVFMDRDFVSVHKNAKRERGQYQAILTELAWSIKDLLYGI